MRKLYILFFLLSLCLGVFSQEITVRFTGQLNGTSYCRLDSVAVTNLTRNWTETIEYPDTIIVLGGIVGTNLNIAATQGLGQNIPNPFDCETRVELSVSQRENVRMQLLDASGKQYADYRGSLGAGVHTFDISAAAPQAYVLNAIVGSHSYSIRMVNMGSGCGSSIKYTGISGSITAKLTSTNEFQNGDNMHYIGYVTIGSEVVASNVVEQPQTASEDITLNFTHCQPLAEHVEVTACDSYEWNNETYNVSGDYQQTFVAANGCDSVVTLHLTINRSNTGIDEQTACDSYTWIDGVTYTESTNEPTFTLTNAEGCDSVVTLHLTINHSNTGIDEQTACDSYTWIDGVTYTESTTEPTFTLTNAVGCDSVVTLHLTINHSNTGIDTQTACDFYTWLDGVTYTESTNEPTFTLTNAAGCDSVVTLHLTINHSNIGIDTQTACDFYTWIDGVTYTESTTEPTFTLTNVEGCDSVVTLHLIINRNTGIDTQSACDSYTWIDGVTYTESTTEPTYTLTNVAGCDSVVTLHLTINHSNTGIYEHTACDSYTWIDGVTYTESTTEPTYTFTNVTGCDSVVTLHLTINHSNTGIDTQIACDNYTWIDGVTYTENTTEPTYTLTNVAGCDSVVTLHLTVNHSNTGTDTQTACDNYTWIDGVTYTESTIEPTYTLTNVAGCDSVVTLHLTINRNTGIDTQSACDNYTWINGITYTESTDEPTFALTNAAGCDSVVTLHLTINHSNIGIDTQTSCDNYTWINGITYTESTNEPTFTLTNVAGCDSVVTLHLTINHSNTVTDMQTACDSYTWIDGVTYTESTTEPTFTLTNAAGCDSVVTLHLTMLCPPTVQTNAATSITSTGVTLNGNVTSDGGSLVTVCGFLYGTSASNLTQNVQSGNGTGNFTKVLTGLTASTTYYYKGYATNSIGTSYGEVMSFTTAEATIPTVITGTSSDITSASATIRGDVTSNGGATVTQRGFYWGRDVSGSGSGMRTVGSGTGSFTLNITGLSGGTTYYYKAYARNSKGTVYGEVCSFTTMATTVPIVTTGSASSISSARATLAGNITSSGGATVTERGFRYGTSEDDLSQSVLSLTDELGLTATDDFSAYLTGLDATTTYYYKAYAKNSAGTGYGEVKSFTTATTTGSTNGHDWVDLGLPSGARWATCNIGANSPEEYGDYFAWGETASKAYYTLEAYRYYNTSTSTYTKYNNSDGITVLQASDDAATANWGNAWKMPGKALLNELRDNCTYEWTTLNGVEGGLFTGPNGNSIFLPAAGRIQVNSVYNSGYGLYWSSSIGGVSPREGSRLYFGSGVCNLNGGNMYRYFGLTVRPICMP